MASRKESIMMGGHMGHAPTNTIQIKEGTVFECSFIIQTKGGVSYGPKRFL